MTRFNKRNSTRLLCGAIAGAVLGSAALHAEDPDAREWARAGQGGVLGEELAYNNALGKMGVLNANGPVDTTGHPFFEPIGTNGRACDRRRECRARRTRSGEGGGVGADRAAL